MGKGKFPAGSTRLSSVHESKQSRFDLPTCIIKRYIGYNLLLLALEHYLGCWSMLIVCFTSVRKFELNQILSVNTMHTYLTACYWPIRHSWSDLYIRYIRWLWWIFRRNSTPVSTVSLKPVRYFTMKDKFTLKSVFKWMCDLVSLRLFGSQMIKNWSRLYLFPDLCLIVNSKRNNSTRQRSILNNNFLMLSYSIETLELQHFKQNASRFQLNRSR